MLQVDHTFNIHIFVKLEIIVKILKHGSFFSVEEEFAGLSEMSLMFMFYFLLHVHTEHLDVLLWFFGVRGLSVMNSLSYID